MLTDRECRNAAPAAKPYKLFDGGGLHLLVLPSGYKSWRLKYRFGREKQLTFGPYPLVSLKEARERRDEAKRELLAGRDPGRKGGEAKARRTGRMQAPTFRSAALRWHALQAHGWKPHHAAVVRNQLEREVFPAIGDLPLAEIRPSDIRPIIDAMQARGAVDQAHRTLMRISRTFELAIVDELVETNPAASLTAILHPVPKRKYPAILSVDAARRALLALEAEPHDPATKLASRLLALTAARPGPLRHARPEEFLDLDGSDPRWVIPAEKMKLELAESRQAAWDFTIPLSRQAVATVKAALAYSAGRPWLFPSTQYALRPLSENALSTAYRRCPAFAGRHVPHGWRSTFSTVMNQRAADLGRQGEREIIDLMLAHKPEGVEAHYNRAAYMPQRRKIAQEWADLLCGEGEGALPPPMTLLEGRRK